MACIVCGATWWDVSTSYITTKKDVEANTIAVQVMGEQVSEMTALVVAIGKVNEGFHVRVEQAAKYHMDLSASFDAVSKSINNVDVSLARIDERLKSIERDR